MSALSEYLSQHLGDRVPDDIVRQAAKAGHRIDRTAVYDYLRGTHAKRPRQSTLDALAAGFGAPVDVRRLRELTGRPPGELGEYVPTREAASLTQDQRDAIDQLIKVFVREGGQAWGGNPVPEEGDDGPTVLRPGVDPPSNPFEPEGSVTHLPGSGKTQSASQPEPEVDETRQAKAARRTGRKSRGQQIRDDQDGDNG